MNEMLRRYGSTLTGAFVVLTAFWLLMLVILPNLTLFEVSFRCNAVDRHDFYHPSIQFAVPDITLREGLNFQSLNQQVTGFYRIAEKIVVIDVIDLKTGILCFLLHLRTKFFGSI